MSVRDIQKTLAEVYGTQVSAELISRVTDAVLEELEEWRTRPLERVYYVVYVDALFAKMRQSGRVSKRAVYTVVGIPEDGVRDVLGIYISIPPNNIPDMHCTPNSQLGAIGTVEGPESFMCRPEKGVRSCI